MFSKCFVGWWARVVVVVEAVKRKSSFAFDEIDDETWNVLRKRKENFLYRSPLTHPFGVWNSIRCVLVCIVTWSTSRLMTNGGCDGNAWKWNFLFLNPARFQRFPLSHFPSSRYVLVTSLPTATQPQAALWVRYQFHSIWSFMTIRWCYESLNL